MIPLSVEAIYHLIKCFKVSHLIAVHRRCDAGASSSSNIKVQSTTFLHKIDAAVRKTLRMKFITWQISPKMITLLNKNTCRSYQSPIPSANIPSLSISTMQADIWNSNTKQKCYSFNHYCNLQMVWVTWHWWLM